MPPHIRYGLLTGVMQTHGSRTSLFATLWHFLWLEGRRLGEVYTWCPEDAAECLLTFASPWKLSLVVWLTVPLWSKVPKKKKFHMLGGQTISLSCYWLYTSDMVCVTSTCLCWLKRRAGKFPWCREKHVMPQQRRLKTALFMLDKSCAPSLVSAVESSSGGGVVDWGLGRG